jgi:zinc protease
MRIRKTLLLFFIILASSVYAQKTQPPVNTLALDPSTHRGILPNGLTYYIFKPENAEKSIQFLFVVRVGSYHGEKNELGAAHFIEHLSLRSTKNFPKGVREYMTAWGLKPGADIVASTTGITQYNLKIPSGDSSLLRFSLLALRDWAKGRNYLPDEVEQERGIVLNEYAMTNTPSFKSTRESIFLSLGKHPAYDPKIRDDKESVRVMSSETLKQFDEKWYRPDLQAIIVVGDVDVATLEKQITKIFSDLKTPEKIIDNDGQLKGYDVQLGNEENLVVVEHGMSQPNIRIEIMQLRKSAIGADGATTMDQLRLKLLDRLYNNLAKQRFDRARRDNLQIFEGLAHELVRRAVHPFAGLDALTTYIELDNQKNINTALNVAMTEVGRIARWGFSTEEVLTAKKLLLQELKSSITSQSSEEIAGQLVAHYVGHVPFPANPLNLYTDILDNIDVFKVNDMVQLWARENTHINVMFSVPRIESTSLPTQKTVLQSINDALKKRTPRFLMERHRPLPSPPPTSDTSFAQVLLVDAGATKVTLKNGIQVLIKCLGAPGEEGRGTPQVLLRGIRPGGAMLYHGHEYASALVSPELVIKSGVASLTGSDLRHLCSDLQSEKYFSAQPYITDNESGINGEASLNKLGDLLNLTYLYLNSPRADRHAFDALIESKDSNAARKRSKIEIFSDSIASTLNPKPRYFSEPRFNDAYRIYKEQFKNGYGFTFVIVGYFHTEAVIQEVVRYLGALPTNKGRSPHRFVPNTSQTKINHQLPENLRVTMVGDSTGNIFVKLLFPLTCPQMQEKLLKIKLLENILKRKIEYRLRERDNYVYYAFVSLTQSKVYEKSILAVDFQATPENIDDAITSTLDEIERFSDNNIDDAMFEGSLTQLRNDLLKQKTNPYTWLEYLSKQLDSGAEISNIKSDVGGLDKITIIDMREIVRECLLPSPYIVFKLL